MKHLLQIIVTAVLVLYAGVAAAGQWTVDPAHSSITFRVKHIYSTVSGHFSDFKADIEFDPDNLDKSRFDFSVQVDSINTYIGKRDRHLRSDDFFHADEYPVMTFESGRIVHKQGDIYTVEGTMTVKDVSKDISVDFTFYGPKPNPMDKEKLVAGFETSFSIDRLEYNVGDGRFHSMGIVGNTVEVLISVEALEDQ